MASIVLYSLCIGLTGGCKIKIEYFSYQ
ncbi:hypothetical protein ACQ27_gp617 [Klebsiella phage K64-1]|nr:hypothetical protein ACQ27_gp617 [Klebsiella phage K64-1]